ncbi:unnamed protein product [Agarophyton chilense]|eukprot:gb/GEZJ01001776.1/.p1 GENE.gb/GEZJ01001776.1/~~gb/GEZJ01001776.1/.p1  ORF type:complete len:803 (-),score=141.25 gb/GEZJ01001776.1/:2239-4647(-)
MRTYVGRTALRGATQLLSGGAPRGAVLVGRTAIASKSLCSTTPLHSDGARRPEDLQISANEKLPLSVEAATDAQPQGEPVVEIISKDVSSTSVLVELEEDVENGREGTVESTGIELKEPLEESEVGGTQPSDGSHRDPKGFSSSLNNLLQKGAVRTALWQFANALKTSDRSKVDKDAISLMIPVLGRSGWSPTSLETLRISCERQYELGSGLYNCGLHAVSRSGDTKSMREILTAMWTLPKDSQPNATSYNYLIGAYMYRGQVDEAFNVLNEMKDLLIHPTFATYHSLITGCLRRRDSQRAFSTLLAVEKQRFDVSAMTVAQVLVSASNNDDFDNVRVLLGKYESALPKYVSEVHRIAESRHMYRIGKHTRTSKEERAAMRGTPKLEIGAISAVLHCAFRGGLPDVALHAWQILEKTYPDFEPPSSLWYCLIGAFSGGGDFSTAIDLVGIMREKGINPSLRDLDMALTRPMASDIEQVDTQYYRLVDRLEGKVHNEEESVEGSEKSLEEEEERLEASATVAEITGADSTDATDAMSKEDDPLHHDEVEAAGQDLSTPKLETEVTESYRNNPKNIEYDDVSKEYIRTRLRPSTVGIEELNCVISACSTAQDLERAFQTYDEVESRFQLEKNIDTFNALLEGCVQTRHIRGGMRVLQEMESQGFNLSGQTLHLAVRLMIRGGRSESTLHMVEEARQNGDYVLPSTYQMLLRHYLRSDAIERAHRMMELGKEAGLSERALTGRLPFQSFDQLQQQRDEWKGEAVTSAGETNSDMPDNDVAIDSERPENASNSQAINENAEEVAKQ